MKRTFQPTASPSGVSSSSAMRAATVRAAMPARLGVPDQPPHPAAEFEADLGELGGLSRAGLPRDDDDLAVADCRKEFVLGLADRQRRRIVDRGNARRTPSYPSRCPGDLEVDRGPICFPFRGVADAAQPVDPPAQPALVAQSQATQAVQQVIGHRRPHKSNVSGWATR
ncbi:MAG: hypothetical protein WKG07_08700 [Hymenobacter sp.]